MLEIEDVQQELHTYTTKATILFSLYNHTGSVILHILLCSTSTTMESHSSLLHTTVIVKFLSGTDSDFETLRGISLN